MAVGTTTALLGGATLAAGLANSALGGGDTQDVISQQQLAEDRQRQQEALAAQQRFAQEVAAQRGLERLGDVYQGLGAIGQGSGPDIAGAQLAQVTGQNVANQHVKLPSKVELSSNKHQDRLKP